MSYAPGFIWIIWKNLEELVRNWIIENDSLFVVTGSIATIGASNVTVPRAFYKTILAYKNGNAKGIAFLIPNEKSVLSVYSFKVPIDQIELITRIDFYSQLDAEVQSIVESSVGLEDW